MSRRTPGHSPVVDGSVQLRTFSGALVTAFARRDERLTERVPQAAGAVAGPAAPVERAEIAPRSEVDRLWDAFLTSPTRPVRDLLLIHYAPLLRSVAHRTAAGLPSHVDVADLVQSGVFGLIEAVERHARGQDRRLAVYSAGRAPGVESLFDRWRDRFPEISFTAIGKSLTRE